MPKFGDTPNLTAPSLCASCKNAHNIKGRRYDHDLTFCNAHGTVPLRITFPVTRCNEYDDKSRPSLWEMEKVAWKFAADRAGNVAGFLSPKKWKDKHGDDD